MKKRKIKDGDFFYYGPTNAVYLVDGTTIKFGRDFEMYSTFLIWIFEAAVSIDPDIYTYIGNIYKTKRK